MNANKYTITYVVSSTNHWDKEDEMKFLGETIVDIESTPFKGYTPQDWALHYIETYGQHDGGHHKQWTMDQIARILKDTTVVIELAKWSNGEQEYRISTGEPSKKYLDWVKYMMGAYDEEYEEYEYTYDEGIAP